MEGLSVFGQRISSNPGGLGAALILVALGGCHPRLRRLDPTENCVVDPRIKVRPSDLDIDHTDVSRALTRVEEGRAWLLGEPEVSWPVVFRWTATTEPAVGAHMMWGSCPTRDAPRLEVPTVLRLDGTIGPWSIQVTWEGEFAVVATPTGVYDRPSGVDMCGGRVEMSPGLEAVLRREELPGRETVERFWCPAFPPHWLNPYIDGGAHGVINGSESYRLPALGRKVYRGWFGRMVGRLEVVDPSAPVDPTPAGAVEP